MPGSVGSVEYAIESERDARFDALADAQRRRLLEYLLDEYPGSVPRSAAVAHVASITERDYRRVETKMIHQHLPRLEEADLVSYDADGERLSYTGDELVRDVLDLL